MRSFSISERIFQNYMELLFDTSQRFVVIMSNDPAEQRIVVQVLLQQFCTYSFWPVKLGRQIDHKNGCSSEASGINTQTLPGVIFFFARKSECKEVAVGIPDCMRRQK